MNNKASITHMMFFGAIASILIWLLGFYRPGLMEAAPAGLENYLTVILTGIFLYFKDPDSTLMGKQKQSEK